MSHSPPTRALVPRSRAATPASPSADDYASLATMHWGPLVRYAATVVRSREAAEDVVQDAFAALWALRVPLPVDRLVPYLYRAVRNLALNERRWGRVRRLWLARQPQGDRPAPPLDDEAALDARVRAALATLPARRREVFELVRFHDLSYRQVAEVLEVAPQTVANHMSAAMRDLRVALHDLLGDPPGPGPRRE